MRKLVFAAAVLGVVMLPARSEAEWVLLEHRILDLNMSGEQQQSGWSGFSIGLFIGSRSARHRANVVTLQEVCASQYPGILAGLKSFDVSWTGTYKNFGHMDGCPGASKRHGLAIFTKGGHSHLEWYYLDSGPNWQRDDERWWGLMKVRYRGVDIFNTHVMNGYKHVQIPQVDGFVSPSPFFLLAGDFNTRPGEELIDAFYRKWYEIDVDAEYTHPQAPSFDPKKIDYVWTNRQPVYKSADVIDVPFSTHRMIEGVFWHLVWVRNTPFVPVPRR